MTNEYDVLIKEREGTIVKYKKTITAKKFQEIIKFLEQKEELPNLYS